MPEDIFVENLRWWFSQADHEEEVKLFSFNIYTAFITIQYWLMYKYEAILLVQPPEQEKLAVPSAWLWKWEGKFSQRTQVITASPTIWPLKPSHRGWIYCIPAISTDKQSLKDCNQLAKFRTTSKLLKTPLELQKSHTDRRSRKL